MGRIMELEDKKILAKWMGITIYNMEILPENPDYPLVWFFKETQWNKSPFYFKIEDEDGEEWGPDYNHNQFKEIWNKLTGPEMDSLNDKLKVHSPWDDHPCHLMEVYCNDPVKVLDAIIEVIKEMKITKVG